MKAILPTLKQKKRYLAFEIRSNTKIKDFKPVSEAINTQFKACFGEFGAAQAGLLMLKEKFNYPKQRGIIKVNHKHVDELKTALMMIKKIGKQNVMFKTIGVSGILNKAEKRYMG